MKTTAATLAIIAGGLLGLRGPASPDARAQDNGIYADFTTSMGDFTCRLDYTNAPKATANFIGLATGARAWLNGTTGFVRTNAFYDGLTFHRVIANFMIQGGSPNGQGTDGPGYVFPDEISPSLKHDGPGVLAMANSGTNSNGAQFYITVTNASWLDGSYTIFGRVTSGQSVVNAIDQVATDADDKPLTNVILQQVAIRRVGTAAQAFAINAQNLPVVSPLPLYITQSAGAVTLTFTNHLYEQNFLSVSSNLVAWTNSVLGVDLLAPVSNSVQCAIAASRQYYAASRVQYPASTLAPRSVFNRKLTLVFDGGVGTLTILFDASGGGTYTFQVTSTGTVTSYIWIQDIYRGYVWPIYYSALIPMTLQLDFASESGGTFAGTAYASPSSFSVSGSFTLGAP